MTSQKVEHSAMKIWTKIVQFCSPTICMLITLGFKDAQKTKASVNLLRYTHLWHVFYCLTKALFKC